MPDINDLRRDRQSAADAMTAAADEIEALEATEGGPDEKAMEAAEAKFAKAEQDFQAADRKVKRAEAVESAQSRAATSGDTAAPTTPQGGQTASSATGGVPATANDPNMRGVAATLMIGALAGSRNDRERAVQHLEQAGHGQLSAALSGASDSAGGVTIPRAQSSELIEMLRPRVAVMNAGARMVDMPAGQLRHGRQATSASAAYGAENAPAVESEPTFDKVDQAFKKLTSLVPVGNSLLRHSSAALAQVVRDDILDVMALKRDLAFLRFDGTGDAPKGLRYWAPTANWTGPHAATASVVEAQLRGLASTVEDSDVPMVRPGWIMRASTKNFLASLRESAGGNYLFPSIEQSNQLLGYPIYTTSQIPNNLGTNSDEVEVYFADFNEIMIGDTMEITIATSTEASFVDASGDTISAFQRDLTLMRAISEHDLAPRHDEAIAGLNGIGWAL